MKSILNRKNWEDWKEQILNDLDGKTMTFTELSDKYDFPNGEAADHKEYHALLELVSGMQIGRKGQEPTLKIANKGKEFEFAIFRTDQEQVLVEQGVLSDESEIDLWRLSREFGINKER